MGGDEASEMGLYRLWQVLLLVVGPGIRLPPTPAWLSICPRLRGPVGTFHGGLCLCWGPEGRGWKALTPSSLDPMCLPGRGTPFLRSSTRC